MASNTKIDFQEKFLKSLKEKIDKENGVDICLWQLPYSYMKLNICYTNKNLVDEKKNLDLIKEEMKLEKFQNLVISFNFKNLVNIKHLNSENEIHFIFEHRRDQSHPHGRLKIFVVILV